MHLSRQTICRKMAAEITRCSQSFVRIADQSKVGKLNRNHARIPECEERHKLFGLMQLLAAGPHVGGREAPQSESPVF